MSTPAAQALSGANASGAAAGASGTPGADAGGAAGAGAQPANQPQFWSGWNLPDQKETREWVANKNYDSPFTLAKTAQTLEREAATLRASKGYPTDTVNADGSVTQADPNARKAWNTAVGVPETSDKYNLKADERFPEFTKFMAQEMHKAGVPLAMAPALQKAYDAANAATLKQIETQENTASEQGLAQLKDAWGANYQERVSLASRGKEWLSKEVGGLDDIQMRTLESVLTTPKFMAAMWKIGAGNGEARFAGGDNPRGFTGGASEAQTRLNQITTERAAGTIKDAQWRELDKPGGELEQLRNRIAGGMAAQQ